MEPIKPIVTAAAGPEQLLRWVARCAVDESRRAQPPLLELDPSAWAQFLREALRHSLLPLAWRALDGGPVELPALVERDLRAAFDANSMRNLRLAGELLTVVDQLSASGVPAVPWKGPQLAERAYGDLRLRQFYDLDLLVRRSDLPVARDVLIGAGFRTEKPMSAREQEAYVDRQGELEFVRESDGLWLELHTAIVPTYYASGRPTDELWQRLRPARVARATVSALDPVDDIEALCVHGSKHRWDRMAWIVDVALMARLLDERQWRTLFEAARRHGTLRMQRLGLLLALDIAGAKVPEPVERFIRRDRVAGLLATQAQELLFDPRPSRFDGLIFHTRMRERDADRARYLVNVAFRPSGADWQLLRLPPRLFALYGLARPLRLALKYGRRLLAGRGGA